MRNILNIDLTKETCNGVYSSASECNTCELIFKIGNITNPYLAIKVSDGTIMTGTCYKVSDNEIGLYSTFLEEYLNGENTIEVQVLADDGYQSDIYTIETISYADGEDIYCKYVNDKFVFNKNAKEGSLFDKIYPVGSLYFNTNDVSPELLFGGTWERIKDTFLLAAGDSYIAGDVGGEAEHKLTVEELPKHHHDLANYNNGGTAVEPHTVTANQQMGWWGNVFTGSTGGDQPHNNMPPYLAVNVWKRVA